jgi:hypothetical protein
MIEMGRRGQLGPLAVVAFALFGTVLSAQTVRRSPDAPPDLQGIWNFSSLTPLERPAQLAGKAVLTEEEAADFERQTLERNNADRRRETADADVSVAYNDAWYDRGTKVVGNKRSSLIVDPPDGRIPALTPGGQIKANARAEMRRQHGPADGPEDRSLAERCLMFNAGPPMLPGPYNNNVQIVQAPTFVVIANEMIHDARIVPLDGRPHLPQTIREDHTLVVDTTNFTEKSNFRGADENLHLVERFTRVDAHTLNYEFTIDDPTMFSRPWTVSLPMNMSEGQIYEYACHEGNYAMSGMLKGARAKEPK